MHLNFNIKYDLQKYLGRYQIRWIQVVT